ncbi:hypothetical protein [Roseinatronobacter alkalisoli]|uniref:Phage tail tape measure protein n=1 Tax=Roseinatronobacter alkalisoli TaxID=3028235 RepID=A0ABT5TEL5_9RHOB|nr:hypothetical protein [Roseinatronobacter sp. HJB301]MDD7973446.1 hypothetical protein [Roseinatronobacter sp. HJB301]
MFKLFEVFGELSMKGAEGAASVMSAAEQQGKGLADTLGAVGDRAASVGDSMTKRVTGPIVAVTGALTAMAFSAISTGDDLAKFSRSVGIGVEALQEYEFALGRIAGLSEGQTRKALEFMNRTLAEGTQGNEKAIETFTRLGFSMEDIVNGAVGTEAAMDAALEAIRGAASEAEAQAIAMDIFGTRQGIALANNIRESAETVEDAREIFRREIGGMTQEQAEMAEVANDAWDQFKRSITSAKNVLAAELLPTFVNVVGMLQESFIPMLVKAARGLASVVQWFNELSPTAQASIGLFIAFVAVLGPVLSIFGRLMKLLSGLRIAWMALAAVKGVVLAALAVVSAPVLLIVGAIAALSAAIWYNRERVAEWAVAIAEFASKTYKDLQAWVGKVLNMFRELPNLIGQAIRRMASNVVNGIRNMVSDSLAALRNLYREAVGNSIIPDLARDVVRTITDMADDSIDETRRMNTGMTDAMPRDLPPGFGRGDDGPGFGGMGMTQVIHLEHAVINTEHQFDRRLSASGRDLTGAF